MAKTEQYVKRDLVNLMQGLLQVENLKGVKFALTNSANKEIISNALRAICVCSHWVPCQLRRSM